MTFNDLTLPILDSAHSFQACRGQEEGTESRSIKQ